MEHPFAQYIQMLGKGRKGSRDLTQHEAQQALEMILAGKVEPVQLGAFLMLMRQGGNARRGRGFCAGGARVVAPVCRPARR